jgi:hypothetical protein
MGEAAKMSAQLGQDALNFYKSIYESDLRPAQQEQQRLAARVTESFLSDSELARGVAQQRIADDAANRPLRDRVMADAMGYDSDEQINQQMGIAAANVNQQFSNALAQKARMESRYGRIGGSFGDTNKALLAQAATASGLMTNAARETKDKAIALRAGANEAMSGRANTGGQFLGIAGNSLSGAMGAGSSAMGDMRANAGMVGQGYNTALGGYGQSASIYGQEFNGRMQGYNAQMQAVSGLAGAAGTFMGLKGSDRRMKTDISVVGKLDSGLTVYRYRYRSGGPFELGVMADEVAVLRPDAYVAGGAGNGFDAVDYSKL